VIYSPGKTSQQQINQSKPANQSKATNQTNQQPSKTTKQARKQPNQQTITFWVSKS